MLKDITLGQYFPGDTAVHRLDPRTKIVLTVVYIAALFVAKGPVSYFLVMAFLASAVIISKIRLKALFKGLKPLVIIIVITGILNVLYTKGEHVLFTFWVFTVTLEGVRTTVFMILRIMMLVAGTFLLTYTTSPIALTDGLERLLRPLKKIRIPVHELAMMMSIALRFIPTLIDETDKIISAQKARGADFETGGLVRRAKALLPILVPLFVGAFRRADELATAMESRCYHGDHGRTRMKVLRYGRGDAAAFILGALLLGGVITLAVFGF